MKKLTLKELNELNKLNSLNKLLKVIELLRHPTNGCPWDIAQTFETLSNFPIEEAYELQNAINNKDIKNIKEELGDLLFSIINLSRHLEIDASEAINQANHKFEKRFTLMEEEVAKDNQEIENLTLVELEEFWFKIKSHE